MRCWSIGRNSSASIVNRLSQRPGRYQLTGDPNAFIPFVNRFMPGGIEVKSINKRAELAGGAPL